VASRELDGFDFINKARNRGPHLNVSRKENHTLHKSMAVFL